jgi:hypothetical protein
MVGHRAIDLGSENMPLNNLAHALPVVLRMNPLAHLRALDDAG